MANPELGAKQVCPNCQTKFYDLNRHPAVCPKCGTAFDSEEAVRSRRVRARSAAPEYEADDEAEVKKPAVEADEFEEADDTPEIDEAAEAPGADAEDVEDDAGGGKPVEDADLGVDFEEDAELEEADSEDVPFLEEQEDEGFEDDDLEHHPKEPGDDR